MTTAGRYRVEQVSAGPGVVDFDLPSGHSYRPDADGSSTPHPGRRRSLVTR